MGQLKGGIKTRYLGGPLNGIEAIIPSDQDLIDIVIHRPTVTGWTGNTEATDTGMTKARYVKMRASNPAGRSKTFLVWAELAPDDLSSVVKEWLV